MRRCFGCMREYDEQFDLCPYCGYIYGSAAQAKNQLDPGTILQGRYILGKVLGQGGFGITYIAWDQKHERAVAIKEYMPTSLASRITGQREVTCYSRQQQIYFDNGLEKLGRECAVVSKFRDLESVVRVYDFIQENGTAYIVMELLRGKTVREILAERTSLTYAETIRIMRPILLTLSAMHAAGIIHRDVAPDNIFVCEDGKVKLLDFGAARVVSDADDKTLSVVLKQGFAPVEQYSSHSRQKDYTDVYAACATMYNMLTGITPPASLDRMQSDTLEPISRRAQLPPYAEKAILRGMQVDARSRTQTTEQLLHDLEPSTRGAEKRKKPPKQEKSAPVRKSVVWISAGAIVLTAAVVAGIRLWPFVSKVYDVSQVAEESEQQLTQAELPVENVSVTQIQTQPETTEPTKPALPFADAKTGDTFTFGTFEQDGNKSNGAEPIVWQVLAHDGTKWIVTSRDCLDNRPFAVGGKEDPTNWKDCALRTWLNNDFYNAAFTAEEKEAIAITNVDNPGNPRYKTPATDNTQDKIFLLSADEATRYFSQDSARQIKPTKYAVSQGSKEYAQNGGNTWWWLRTPGEGEDLSGLVQSSGAVKSGGTSATTRGGIRPVMTLQDNSNS